MLGDTPPGETKSELWPGHCACGHRCKSTSDQAPAGDGATVNFLMVDLFFFFFFGHSATRPSTQFHYKSTFRMIF